MCLSKFYFSFSRCGRQSVIHSINKIILSVKLINLKIFSNKVHSLKLFLSLYSYSTRAIYTFPVFFTLLHALHTHTIITSSLCAAKCYHTLPCSFYNPLRMLCSFFYLREQEKLSLDSSVEACDCAWENARMKQKAFELPI